MNTNNGHAQLVAQWITSLAISVICCAVLFVVFAGYIVDLQGKINLATVRLEVYQDKNNQLSSEISYLRHILIMHGVPQQQPAAQADQPQQAQPEQPQPSPSGVEISEPAPAEPGLTPVQGEMTPVAVPLPGAAPKPAEPPKQPAPAKPTKTP